MKSKVFISYSWDSVEHKEWVKKFAEFLESEDINVSYDTKDLGLGDTLTEYMESKIRESDFVLIICTMKYKKKSDNRIGGVGYEGDIITGELFTTRNNRKFIPVLREGHWDSSMPSWLLGRMGIELTGDVYSKEEINNLITTLKKDKVNSKSSIVHNHIVNDATITTLTQKDTVEVYEDIFIEGIIVDDVTLPKNDGTRGSALYSVPFRLSKMPSGLWESFFLEAWRHPQEFTTMHRSSIASVYGRKIILNGTTLEEIDKYHKKTLISAVRKANDDEKREIQKDKLIRIQREKEKREYEEHIKVTAAKIKF